jgi:hypothetical protein
MTVKDRLISECSTPSREVNSLFFDDEDLFADDEDWEDDEWEDDDDGW